jgi:uncharacterized protein
MTLKIPSATGRVATMNCEYILRKLGENRETIRGFGVHRLGIFGSFARGEQSGASAVEFIVDFEKATFDNYFNLKFFLEDLFGRTVDLVDADAIKPGSRSTILEETVYLQGL